MQRCISVKMGSGKAPSEGAAGAVSMGTHGPNGSHGLWGRGRVSGPESGTANPQIGWYESHKSYGLGARAGLACLPQPSGSRGEWVGDAGQGLGRLTRSLSLALDGFAGLANLSSIPKAMGSGRALRWLDIELLGMPKIPAKAGKCKGRRARHKCKGEDCTCGRRAGESTRRRRLRSKG